ncbi:MULTISPECIES: DUF4240 domain-containing protein [unclassified Kribbella]|uniref:DUF4240 domain-containing protein n=1 Tax=unclassified Kribbella TaxID=2644121 RepID=UPI003016B39C
MDFWGLIGANAVETAGEVSAALERVSGRLDGLESADLIQFVEQLQERLFWIDRRELAEIPVRLRGLEWPQTSDHFLYARCACILAGKSAYDLSSHSPTEFARFVVPSSLYAEGLLYLAPIAYHNKTGREMDPVRSFPIDSMSNPQGWNAR